jgi:hypothetical protein
MSKIRRFFIEKLKPQFTNFTGMKNTFHLNFNLPKTCLVGMVNYLEKNVLVKYP